MPRRLSTRFLLLVALVLAATLATPTLGAKKAASAAKKSGAKKSSVGVVDTDEDDVATGTGALVGGYGNLGWITVDQFEV